MGELPQNTCTPNITKLYRKEYIMKKLALLLMLTLMVSLSGCKDKEEPKEAPKNISRQEETKEPVNTDKGTEDSETAPEAAEEDKDEAEDKPEAVSETKTLAEIRSLITADIGAADAAELDADAMSSIYGFDTAHIAEAAGFVLMEGTFPHEVIMVKGKDAAATAALEALLKVKLESFVEQSKGYDPENYALAQKCKVEKKGNYVALFLSPDCEQIKTTYEKYIK